MRPVSHFLLNYVFVLCVRGLVGMARNIAYLEWVISVPCSCRLLIVIALFVFICVCAISLLSLFMLCESCVASHTVSAFENVKTTQGSVGWGIKKQIK